MKKKELTSSEIKNVLRHLIENNQKLAEKGIKTVAYSIEGNSGIGKTSIVHQIADESGMGFARVNLAEATVDDLIGIPIKEYEYKKGEESIWINEKLIEYYIDKGYIPTHRSQSSYAKPMWLTGKEDKPMILFLDDCNRGSVMMQQATMTIIDEGRYISWSLPKGSTVVLSNNPDNGDFLVTSTDTAHKTLTTN